MELTPDFSIVINGDTAFPKDRVISIRTTDEAGIVSDSCEIGLDDFDDAIQMPNTEAKVEIAPGKVINVAVCSGLGNARKVLDMVRADPNRFQAIEIMACPGGCINGGGQPFLHGDTALLEKRMKGIYSEDEKKTLRLSHENSDIKALYAEFLGEPGSEKAHHLLHTHYHSK